MKRSEIFEEFAKIAQEKKIISNDSKKSFKALENNPRADSLDVSAIAALYGVKPETSDDMKYKSNIMEIAHPNSLVISPANDRINGLVENNIERQNINLRIVNKNPDGLLTQRRYAQQQLALSLVRVANDLNHKNKIKLNKLADSCLREVNHEINIQKYASFKKEAVWWYYAVPIALALVYAQQHLNYQQENFVASNDRLLETIDKLLDDTVSWGWGNKLKDTFKNYINGFRQAVVDFRDAYDTNIEILNTLENVTPEDAEKLAKDNSRLEKLSSAFNELDKASKTIKKYSDYILVKFKDPAYKQDQILDKGWITKMLDYTQVLKGGWGVFSDNFDDILRALEPYNASVKKILESLNAAKRYKVQVADKFKPETFQTAVDSSEPPAAAEPGDSTSSRSVKSPSSQSSDESEIESRLADLAGKATSKPSSESSVTDRIRDLFPSV